MKARFIWEEVDYLAAYIEEDYERRRRQRHLKLCCRHLNYMFLSFILFDLLRVTLKVFESIGMKDVDA